MRRFALAVAVCLGAGQVSAFTGMDLLKSCQSQRYSYGMATCHAYIQGVVDGMWVGRTSAVMRMFQESGDPEPPDLEKFTSNLINLCIPPMSDNTPIYLVVIDHLKQNPQSLQASADTAILSAVRAAFPCFRE